VVKTALKEHVNVRELFFL